MERQKQAYVLAVIAVLFWSTVASAFKISLKRLDFLQLLFYASAVSMATLLTILRIEKKLSLISSYSKNEYLRSALLGFLNPFLYYVVLFKAYSILPAQEALCLNYIWPITLVLLSIMLLKEKIKFKNVFALVVSFFGVVVIGTRGKLATLKFSNPLGVALAVGSSVIWALFWIFNKKDSRDEATKLFLNFTFGFIFIAVATFSFSEIVVPQIVGFFGAVYVGVFEMGITFLVWLKALKLSENTAKVGNLIFLSPFMSLIFIHYIVGEEMLLSTILGLGLIIIGIMIQRR